MSLSTWTLLNASCDMTGACCPWAIVTPARHTIPIATAIATAPFDARIALFRRRRKRRVVWTEEEVAAVGERCLLTVPAGAGVFCLVAFDDDLESRREVGRAQAAVQQRRRAARFDRPVLDLAVGT